jgi:hypothetical protein
MDEEGVDLAVVSAVVAPGGDGGQSANAFVHEAVKAHDDRLVGFACVVPYTTDAPDMVERYVKRFGFRGLKLHPSVQQFYPSDQGIYPVVEKAIELDIPILIHTGAVPIPGTRSRYDDPLEIDDLALVYPEAKIVMAHGDPFGSTPAIAGKHPNVYMDTTTTFARFVRLIPGLGEDTLEFMGLVSGESGSSKVLFGSDANPVKTYRLKKNLDPLLGLDIPDEEKSLILGGNAAQLLKIA